MTATIPTEINHWLLTAGEPWTRYRTLLDLLDRSAADAEVQSARAGLLTHPQVQALVSGAAAWEEVPMTRHNDSAHPLYQLSTLADFGLGCDDPGVQPLLEAVLAQQSPEGAFRTLVQVPAAFGGKDVPEFTWMACDAPTLLYVLLAMSGADARTQKAVDHLLGLVEENGWRCAAAPEMMGFRGPGRKADPCPVANLYALKALAQLPHLHESPAVQRGVEMLLGHWEQRRERKYYLFGMGTDFAKLKYPFVWYDLLHVLDVLSRFPAARRDPRFGEMLAVLTAQADAQGRYTASSMYRPWKDWSFANKKTPSPWLTFLVLRIARRAGE